MGKWLLQEAVAFAQACGYKSIILSTVSILSAAAHLYQAAGFRKIEEKPGKWGATVIEEKYALVFGVPPITGNGG